MAKKGIHNQKGFSLMEVIVAMMLLASVSVGILQIIVSARQQVPAQTDRSVQLSVARNQVESLYEGVRQDWWSDAGAMLTPGTVLGNAQDVALWDKTFRKSYATADVTLNGDGGGQDYRRAEVVVQ